MPVFESSRKVLSSGSSLATTLPSLFVKVNEIEKGSILTVFYDLNGVLIVSQSNDIETIRDDIIEILDEIEKKVT